MSRIVLLTIVCSFYFVSAQKIIWTQNKLHWNNFKAKENNSVSNKNTVAFAYCGISHNVTKSSDLNGNISISVKAVFYEDKSWKKNENPGDYILNHEQQHFNIAEVYARKIRKMVNLNIKKSLDYINIFKPLYNNIYQEYLEFQKKYDLETENSTKTEKQEEYNLMVQKMLEELKEYS